MYRLLSSTSSKTPFIKQQSEGGCDIVRYRFCTLQNRATKGEHSRGKIGVQQFYSMNCDKILAEISNIYLISGFFTKFRYYMRFSRIFLHKGKGHFLNNSCEQQRKQMFYWLHLSFIIFLVAQDNTMYPDTQIQEVRVKSEGKGRREEYVYADFMFFIDSLASPLWLSSNILLACISWKKELSQGNIKNQESRRIEKLQYSSRSFLRRYFNFTNRVFQNMFILPNILN